MSAGRADRGARRLRVDRVQLESAPSRPRRAAERVGDGRPNRGKSPLPPYPRGESEDPRPLADPLPTTGPAFATWAVEARSIAADHPDYVTVQTGGNDFCVPGEIPVPTFGTLFTASTARAVCRRPEERARPRRRPAGVSPAFVKEIGSNSGGARDTYNRHPCGAGFDANGVADPAKVAQVDAKVQSYNRALAAGCAAGSSTAGTTRHRLTGSRSRSPTSPRTSVTSRCRARKAGRGDLVGDLRLHRRRCPGVEGDPREASGEPEGRPTASELPESSTASRRPGRGRGMRVPCSCPKASAHVAGRRRERQLRGVALPPDPVASASCRTSKRRGFACTL